MTRLDSAQVSTHIHATPGISVGYPGVLFAALISKESTLVAKVVAIRAETEYDWAIISPTSLGQRLAAFAAYLFWLTLEFCRHFFLVLVAILVGSVDVASSAV